MQEDIVKKEMLGNTKVIICKNYAVASEEERIAILTDLKQFIYEITKKMN